MGISSLVSQYERKTLRNILKAIFKGFVLLLVFGYQFETLTSDNVIHVQDLLYKSSVKIHNVLSWSKNEDVTSLEAFKYHQESNYHSFTYNYFAPLTSLKVNFQDAATIPPAGWVSDFGQSYAQRTSPNQGTGNVYGWLNKSSKTPLDMSLLGRDRNNPSDVLLATFMHMQPNAITEGMWEAQVTNGSYLVTVSVGDAFYIDSKHYVNIEGVSVISNFIPTSSIRFKMATVRVTVTDGRLTLDATGGTNTKVNYIIIQPEYSLFVNFQDSTTVPPIGWLRDFGQGYGLRSSLYQGSGSNFGWINRSDNTPLDLTKNGKRRYNPSDILLATMMHMQGDDVVNFTGAPIEGRWEAQVANGIYDVTVSVGDGSYINSTHSVNIEGVSAILHFTPTSSVLFKSATVTVKVSDGRLTVDAFGGTNTKINYISYVPSTTQRPFIVSVNPKNTSTNINQYTSISTSIVNLPNGGINNSTITTSTVYLTEEASGSVVSAHVNGTGGGDAITLVPATPLKLNTNYVLHVTNGVKDLTGAAFLPFTSIFTTTAVATTPMSNVKFDKIALPNATGRHSSLTIGPDGKLYALSIDGIIKRFAINSDGTLTGPELIYALQDAYGTRQPRLAVGFAFDPASTPTNLIAWVTHSAYAFLNAPDWASKLTRLSGPNLQYVQDVLINLPRSTKDHLTNSIAFGPDGALYFTQGSISAMGKADQTWNNREEHLMSAAVLRLDKTKLGSLPVDVRTKEGGGSYNPFALGAPLTIYASGVRNAYDLVWHSNGELYVATNGSAAGGNTPASVAGTLRTDGSTYNGPSIPSLTNVQQTQNDYLFRVRKGGYYGHPNMYRGEYVMNGGNPTTGTDLAQVDAYPVGTRPDVNWRGYAFDFQANKSPNGAIEYKSNTFNGALKNKLMVVRYSQNDDIIVLTPGGANNIIVGFTEGPSIQGFNGFVDPLDLTEDVRNGNIYVSEYGGDGKITLLKPSTGMTALSSTTLSSINIVQNDTLSNNRLLGSAYLKQNIPNPFYNSTTIPYFVPFYAGSAKLLITDIKGAILKTFILKEGNGLLRLDLNGIAEGIYTYSLWIDNKQIDRKQMIVSR